MKDFVTLWSMNKLFIAITALLLQGTTLVAAPSSTLAADTTKKEKPVVKSPKAEKGDVAKVAPQDSTKAMKDHEGAPKDKKEEKKLSDYAKLIKKGGSRQQGLFTVRHIEDKWYFEVPEKQLGKMFIAVTRFTSVPAGFPKNIGEEVNENVVYFEKHDAKHLWLRNYVKNVFGGEEDDITPAVDKASIDPVIASFNIIQQADSDKADGLLIDVTPFLMMDNQVTSFDNSDRKYLKVGGLLHDLSAIDTIQTYPINMEIKTLRTYSCEPGLTGATQTGFVTLSLNTSLVALPEEPMQPRYDDERVGYFNVRRTEYTDKDVKHKAIIARYRLEPKDEKAYRQGRLTEPKKQIVYYIDPATPEKWVPYLMAGINDWNKAFEAAGFKNAIVAKRWPKDAAEKGMSVDDARYCVLRYLPSEIENAYGPHVSDPRSGEILESHICWYHNVMQLVHDWYMVQCAPSDPRARTMHFDDELMGQLIRFVSSHEVGHTLGLRHNMVASSSTPVENLRNKAWVEKHGHTVSIMDYARFNYVAQPEDHVSHKGLFPRINDYDCWAIKWGYQWRPEFKGKPLAERDALRKEVTAKLKKNPSLRYVGDEGRGMDPRSQTEDLGNNSMKASDYGMKNLKRVIAGLPKWTAQTDGQTEDLEEMYKAVLSQYRRYCGHVQRNLAGTYNNNWPAEKNLDYVPKATQQEVLSWIDRNVLTVPEWMYPEAITTKIGFDPNDDINNHVTSLITYLMSADLITVIGKQAKYPVDEYLSDVFNIVWKPTTGMTPFQAKWRRAEERAYVNSLNIALMPKVTTDKNASIQPATRYSDTALYLLAQLDKTEACLQQQVKAAPAGSLNAAHYRDLLLKVQQIRGAYNKIEK